MELTPGQLAVVAHEIDGGPCRVTGGFGSGVTMALHARAERLRSEGRRPQLLRHSSIVGFAVELLRRHGRPVSLLSGDELVATLATLVDERLRPVAAEVTSAIVGFQASFLGDEELRVHADAAGMLDAAEELIAVTARYVALRSSRNRIDAAGAVVAASLLLRDREVLDAERSRFDELLIDDFQLASFATHRLVSQLAGHGGALTVGGNAEAAVSTAPLSSAQHLLRFDRRFGTSLDVRLEGAHRSPGVPTLRIVEDDADARRAAEETIAAAVATGIDVDGTAVITRSLVESAVGRSWPLVVVPDATDGTWPGPRPVERWFDTELFHGPDLPDDDARDRQWADLERRRFRVACSRATELLVVIAQLPVTPFVGDLVGRT